MLLLAGSLTECGLAACGSFRSSLTAGGLADWHSDNRSLVPAGGLSQCICLLAVLSEAAAQGRSRACGGRCSCLSDALPHEVRLCEAMRVQEDCRVLYGCRKRCQVRFGCRRLVSAAAFRVQLPAGGLPKCSFLQALRLPEVSPMQLLSEASLNAVRLREATV